MVKLVAFQVKLGAAEIAGQPVGEIKGARTPDIMLEIMVELGLKAGVVARVGIGCLNREHQRHQGLGDKAPAKDAEMAAFVRTAAEGIRNLHGLPFAKRRCTTEARRARRKAQLVS